MEVTQVVPIDAPASDEPPPEVAAMGQAQAAETAEEVGAQPEVPVVSEPPAVVAAPDEAALAAAPIEEAPVTSPGEGVPEGAAASEVATAGAELPELAIDEGPPAALVLLAEAPGEGAPSEEAPVELPAEYLAEVVPIGVAHPAPLAEEAPVEETPPPVTPTETVAADPAPPDPAPAAVAEVAAAPAVWAPAEVTPVVAGEPAEVPPVQLKAPAPAVVGSGAGARRTIERIYLRSVLRFAALFSLVAGLIFLLLGGLAYFVLTKTGEVRAFETFLQNGGYPTFKVQASSVFGMLFVLVVVASALFITACLLWAWIYNLVADASGGIEVLTRE